MFETDETPIDTPVAKLQSKTVPIHGEEGVSIANTLARTSLSPEFGAMLAVSAINDKSSVHRDVALGALLEELMAATRDEDATGIDRLLTQAIVLDRLFTHLTSLAMRQDYVSQIAPALTLALRAQAQCRATLQAVSDIRHPRQYIGQQNVGEQYNAGGHQQVNRDAHGEEGEYRPTELSEGSANELHPDNGAQTSIGRVGEANPALKHSTGPTAEEGERTSSKSRWHG